MGKLLSSVLLALALSVALVAAAKEREVQRTSGLSQKVYEKVAVIQQLAEDKQFVEAETQLNDLLQDKLSDYERAQAWFLMGFLRYSMDDMAGALDAYGKVLATEDLSLGMQVNVLRTLAQLHMMAENYGKALSFTDRLIATDPEPHAANHILRAQILYQMERLDESMTEIDRAIALNAQNQLPPRENWLLLKNAIYYSRNDYKGMLKIVQQLTDLYPRDRYLLNMAAIYGELGNSKRQLSLLEPLYEKGSLANSTHMVNLASLYMLHDIPYKAAVMLEREITAENLDPSRNNLEMLAQAWLLAARPERAAAPQKEAAALADHGRGYVSLARIHMSLLQWDLAEWALQKAFEKGDIRDIGGARLMLGMAQFNQKNFRDARRSFARAGEEPKTEKLAQQWLAYLEREEAQAELARSAGMEY